MNLKNSAYILLTLAFCSCGPDEKPVVEEKTPVESEKPLAAQTINRDAYSLTIPADLREDKTLNPEASLAYISANKDRFVMVFDEPRTEVYKTMKANGEYNDSLSFLENFSRKRIELFMEGISLNYPAVKGSINSKSGQLITYQSEGKRSDVPYDITTYFAFAAGKENCYAIMAWSIKDSSKTFETSADEIFKSFDVKK